MIAYKFLAGGRRGVFSGFEWPEREWVEGDATQTCVAGIHACRVEHLAYWVLGELWEVELDGDVVETALKVVAPRGRLLRRVDTWDDAARADFMAEGVRRTAHYAALELREVGLEQAALGLDADEPDALAAAAEVAQAAAAEAGERDATDLTGYVADAAGYAAMGHVVGPAFIAAHAAELHAPVGVDEPFAAERASQGLWLARRLGLTADGA